MMETKKKETVLSGGKNYFLVRPAFLLLIAYCFIARRRSLFDCEHHMLFFGLYVYALSLGSNSVYSKIALVDELFHFFCTFRWHQVQQLLLQESYYHSVNIKGTYVVNPACNLITSNIDSLY